MGQTELTSPIGWDGGRADADAPLANRFAERAVRPYDLLLRAACQALVPLRSALGLRRAAGVLRHYLRGTGTPYRVDADALLALPAVRSAAGEQLERWRAEALEQWRGGPRTAAAYPADSGWREVALPRAWGSADWRLAVRAFAYRLTGTVRVAADGTASADYRFAVLACWDAGRFARLHDAGLAKGFAVTGEAFGHV
ncbi:hypothetical protein B7P34_16590 [Streptosporangium nondiastaticum]|uniref:Uncharacterized protein n=1 Tax=Streptosporangium nondiastaticum TaxID=35764 RepID=A0A9X7JQ13_9ACTN|nr:hypothetical protein [Streptosporangium nondiastaticum]PSJ27666.1 hypothetical protein B7P34_16590 [Streptosporangium nondiastaticum]